MIRDEISVSSQPRPPETIVVLFAPGEISAGAVSTLEGTLQATTIPVRWLILVGSEEELRLKETLLAGSPHRPAVEIQWLLATGVPEPEDSAMRWSQMPPGSDPEELEGFALALSDVVFDTGTETARLKEYARKLNKTFVHPGEPLSFSPSVGSLTEPLDPLESRWNAFGKHIFGRLEQLLLALLSISWFNAFREAHRKHRRKIFASWKLHWFPAPHFAPQGWEQLIPDESAADPNCPIALAYERMDRSALYGSFLHRDLVWVVHLASAFAVLTAVAGHLQEHVHQTETYPFRSLITGREWPLAELGILALVLGMIVFAQFTHLLDRWTACRLGAEQLRIARLCVPLYVVPPALSTVDQNPPTNDANAGGTPIRRLLHRHSKAKHDFALQSIMEVKRAVRQQGLPTLRSAVDPVQAAKWLSFLVEDQISYHKENCARLESAESKLLNITTLLFMVTMAAVITHLFIDAGWLLLLTASGPAFAAAVHGAGTRLGIKHRAALSEEAHKKLEETINELTSSAVRNELTWDKVRVQALKAAEAMGNENTSWHGLVRRERDGLPA